MYLRYPEQRNHLGVVAPVADFFGSELLYILPALPSIEICAPKWSTEAKETNWTNGCL
ncbi:hypothetical protein VTN96DRAFT_1142 [Rasamsonia emersonii]